MTAQNEKFYDIEIVVEGYPTLYITKKLYLTVNKKERAVVQEFVKNKVVEDLPNTKHLVKHFILRESYREEVNVVVEKVSRLKINVTNADMSLFTERLDTFGGHTVCIIPLPLDQKIKEIQEEIDERRRKINEIRREIEDIEEEIEEDIEDLEEEIENLEEEIEDLEKEIDSLRKEEQ